MFGDDQISTGPSSDLRTATQIARGLVMEYGMSDALGQRTYGQREDMIFLGREIHEQRDYSEKIAEQIDNEVRRVIDEGKKHAEKILTEHKDRMEALVATLLKDESVEQEEFEKIMKATV